LVTLDDIRDAALRLQPVVVRTPLITSPVLDDLAGGTVLLKAENLQRTGSFKIRGAYNLLSQLSPEQARNGAVAYSSGNHAQAVAAAGTMLGIETTIVMPEDAPAMSYLAAGGLSFADLREVFQSLNKSKQIVAVSMSTWNPELDKDRRSRDVCMELLRILIGE